MVYAYFFGTLNFGHGDINYICVVDRMVLMQPGLLLSSLKLRKFGLLVASVQTIYHKG